MTQEKNSFIIHNISKFILDMLFFSKYCFDNRLYFLLDFFAIRSQNVVHGPKNYERYLIKVNFIKHINGSMWSWNTGMGGSNNCIGFPVEISSLEKNK